MYKNREVKTITLYSNQKASKMGNQKLIKTYSPLKHHIDDIFQENENGTHGFEPRSFRSAVECSTTELHLCSFINISTDGLLNLLF